MRKKAQYEPENDEFRINSETAVTVYRDVSGKISQASLRQHPCEEDDTYWISLDRQSMAEFINWYQGLPDVKLSEYSILLEENKRNKQRIKELEERLKKC